MDEQMDTKVIQPSANLGLLLAPLAVLLALATTRVVGIDYDLTLTNMMPMLVVVAASLVALAPRLILSSQSDLSSTTVSLGVLGFALIGAEVLYAFADVDAVAALMFAIIVIFGSNFDMRGRHEWLTAMIFSAVGFWLAVAAAGDAYAALPSIYTMESGQLVSTMNLERQATAYVFFAYWTMFTAAGLMVGVLARGTLNPCGNEGWFSFLGQSSGFNRNSLPLVVAFGVWVLAFAGSLWHFNSVSVVDQLGITTENGYHGYVGYWSAFLTGVVALIMAGMVAERWYTRAMLVGSMWTLYQVAAWFEAGIWYSEDLDGTWGALIWLAITFFIAVGIYSIGNHERYGGWANRGEHEPSQARLFLRAHGAGMMIGLAFLIGLAIRVQWYAVPSMNAFGTGNWDMTGGSDPWYMKRVVDYILANNAHLIVDADRFYPIGGINPRPPLFSWSMAVGAMLLEPFLNTPEDAVWWSMLALPAVYGALTVFPIASMAKDHFGKGAGVLAAWLIAFMPAHVTHSTWALADHDAFVMLFISVGFMYWLRAVKYAGSARISKTTSPHPLSFVRAFHDVAANRQAALANAALAGVAFGIVSLGWKGFVVGPSILFLAYALQVALNMFRRRDSTTLSVMFLVMLATTFLMALPFYAHPQLNLVFDSTGLQPFLFIFGFTIAIAFVTTGFRDKPWLLVLGTLTAVAAVFFAVLYVLKTLEISDAWDVLFTGSGYFTKTKIFGTVAEANAPNRAQLFASFGPITFLLALIMGGGLLWRGLRHRNGTALVFGVWVFAATFMAWNAARFMFNATPIMAILGAAGIVAFWQWADWSGLVRSWKKFGIRTPADRISGARKAVWRTPQFSAVFLVMIMIFGQQATYGLDSAIPGTSNQEAEIDERIYNIMPDIMRFDGLGFSILDSSTYDGRRYLGSFGSSFNDNGWNAAYEWLANQDTGMAYSEKPAFVSWWDYGFQALSTGEHPSVSDNFQSGIPATGNMLLARNQDDLTAMFIWQLAEGDRTYATEGTDYQFTPTFAGVVQKYLDDDQWSDFETMQTNFGEEMIQFIEDRSFNVVKTNRDVVMAEGYLHTAGVFGGEKVYKIYKDQTPIPCTDAVSTSCVGDAWSSMDQADITFNNNVRTNEETVNGRTHTIIGDYWYTDDLLDEYLSVSTSIHRKNARLALATQLLTAAFDANPDATIHDLYNDLINLEGLYRVQDYEGAPGETISRDHEIRYFAIDDRLYPRAGRYTADANYNRGQPMGIFGAPTILSGQDIGTYMDEVYETVRGDFQDEMTREEVDEAMQKDFLNQQAGADIDPLQIEDVRVDHNPAFFETMVARTYVGYGASTLGLNAGSSNPQPSQHFGQSGSPGTIMTNALPLPGAMMNHFVIANWYSEVAEDQIQSTNTLVKILKYYPGAEMTGQVTMSDNGQGLPGVRLLIERDAFSGETGEDLDEDTYWVPIGFVDADENGRYSFLAPAGKIRVSAFAGVFDASSARDNIRDGSYGEGLSDILTETNDDRQINEITAVLGQVANMTWLGESLVNVTADEANRVTDMENTVDIAVESSGVSGTVVWSGDEAFNGDPISETTFILRNIWSMTDNYTVETTSGSFTSDESRILQGTGEATLVEDGSFDSEGIALASNFIGTFTRDIGNDRSFFANGTWSGNGVIEASWVEPSDVVNCDADNESNAIMPVNETFCRIVDEEASTTTYRLEGTVDAMGTFTSEGTSTLTRSYGDADAGQGETLEGAGLFEGTGTFNGTGLFIGVGSFSGPMVEPGSFYKTGLLPGTYNMIAQLDNGKEVLLPDPVEIGIDPSYDLAMTMPGAIFKDTLKDMHGDAMPNQTIEFVDVELGDDAAVMIMTDEEGNFSYGPIPPGNYYYRGDVDNDGWYDYNESAFVNDDISNITLELNVPDTVDVTLTLVSPVDPQTQEALFDVADRTITFENELGLLDPINVTSDENGEIYVELLFGVWDIRDDVNPEFVLFDQIDLEPGTDDVLRDVTYAQAAYINGSMRNYPGVTVDEWDTWNQETPEENRIQTTQAADGLTLNFVSDNLAFSAVTNFTGNFSVRVPSGFTYHMTTESVVTSRGYGALVPVETGVDVDLGALYIEPTGSVNGIVHLYDNTTRWDSSFPLWEAPEVVATNDAGLMWTTTTNELGDFAFDLPSGIWTISLTDERLNATSVDDLDVNRSNTETLSTMELFANPEAVEVEMHVFLNAAEDGTFENGTMATPDFTLKPIAENRDPIYFTAEDYTEPGIISVSLTPGGYDLLFNQTAASDENATDYDLVGETFFDAIRIGLDAVDEPYEVALKNTYLVTGTLHNSTNEGIANDFLLYNEADDQWFNIGSDENGSFAAYVPAGEWLIIVAPFSNGDHTETLRQPLSVEAGSERKDLELTTQVSVRVSMQLLEAVTEASLSDMTVTAVSHDGFGNITFERTDADGNASELLMPGTWSFYFNRTIGTKSWFMDTSDAPFSTDAADENNSLVLDPVYATLEVEIGGKVFWDLDNNSAPSLGEGLPDMTVTLVGNNNSEVSTTVSTDEDGVWRVFVPIRDVYNVSVEKEGFETVYYATEDQGGYTVHDSPDSTDIEVTAGLVEVEGTITDQLDADRLVDATIVLYPVAGVERDPVHVSGTMNGTTLEWSADVQPGDWVVVISQSNPGPNGGGVSIGLLDATVANGGNISMVMALGGYVDLATSWSDIDQNVHHAGSSDPGADMIQGTVELEVSFDGQSWMVDVPASGELRSLFPEGSVSFDGEFMTVQHETALEMEYYGGQTTTVTADSTIAATLQFNRRVNSALDITFNQDTLVNATVLNPLDTELQAEVSFNNESAYSTIVFDYDVVYNGTEIQDVFSVEGEMGLAQDSDLWTVQFWNASSGAYEDTINVALGIGDANTDAVLNTSVRVQLTLPPVEDAWHLQNGHRMTLRLETDLGESSQASVKVIVPQTFGFTVSENTEEVGMSALVERQFSFALTNNGNGQDTFTIELYESGVPADWSVTPMMSTLTLNKDETRTQQFTVFAPASYSEDDADFDLTVYINSQDESVDGEEVKVTIKKAAIVLTIDEGRIATESDQIAERTGAVRIPVVNAGLLDAPSVIVYLTPPGGDEMSQSIAVPAGGEGMAVFDGLSFSQGNQRFDYRVEVAGAEAESVESKPDAGDFSIEYNIETTADGESVWMTLLIALLAILVVYGGVRTARSRGGAKF
ncbi:MAG: STT3 domain-containing protein [Candidatus Thermoplasmatota archaeon]|nr:STT3 domain-containing protein [Candidatus Thermoplasmatota archaeon]